MSGMEGKMIVVCDNPALLQNVISNIRMEPGMEFISSEREDERLKALCERITNDRWRKAGYAHLTTFFDANKRGEEEFWNIDADDTVICLSVERTREALSEAREYAKDNDIKIFSLDMHTTRTGGGHWSFGITYTDNTVDWLSLMEKYSDNEKWQQVRQYLQNTNGLVNIDSYYTYLRKYPVTEGISTFYLEHLRFIHYSTDFISSCLYSGVYYWHEGKLYSPVLSDVLQLEGYVKGESIPTDVEKIDIGVTENESLLELQCYATGARSKEQLPEPEMNYSIPWTQIDQILREK
ncbi:MAG: hypothetical protein K5853_07640 [Lachnospiraceae bacterium]|nr:hypothetical protein [Lachnospiraceae bacterium]